MVGEPAADQDRPAILDPWHRLRCVICEARVGADAFSPEGDDRLCARCHGLYVEMMITAQQRRVTRGTDGHAHE